MIPHEPMEIRRIQERNSSWIEPALDPFWSEVDRLRWHAGVVLVDSGVRIRIVEGAMGRRILGKFVPMLGVYGYSYDCGGGGAMSYDGMWAFLNGVELGARLGRSL